MMIRDHFRAGDFRAGQPSEAHIADVRELYFALLDDCRREQAMPRARRYLVERLQEACDLADELPPEGLPSGPWLSRRLEEVGDAYRRYLDARTAGRPRRFFSNRAHALYFLRGVAPTKLVDGAWLHGLLRRWRDPQFLPLIRTYLEELGDGSPDLNHVVLYRNLLASVGCEDWEGGRAQADYVQGAIQLALAFHADEFLPEVIGFNLGYEQLPLHLLITAHELDELGIDPYYFTLHVTVDNAANGHARKALKSVADIAPTGVGREEFLRRVRLGYRLNMLGSSTESVIRGFDLDAELIRVLADKSAVGRYMHSDHCRIGGRSVTQWLAERGNIRAFLDALQQQGWIKRGRPPSESRFWQLIRGERAEMFGVFSAYEVQVLEDWIAGDAAVAPSRSFRQMERLRRARAKTGEQAAETSDDEPRLEERLAECVDRASLLDALPRMMSPSRHHTVAGLFATRMFSETLGVAPP